MAVVSLSSSSPILSPLLFTNPAASSSSSSHSNLPLFAATNRPRPPSIVFSYSNLHHRLKFMRFSIFFFFLILCLMLYCFQNRGVIWVARTRRFCSSVMVSILTTSYLNLLLLLRFSLSLSLSLSLSFRILFGCWENWEYEDINCCAFYAVLVYCENKRLAIKAKPSDCTNCSWLNLIFIFLVQILFGSWENWEKGWELKI